LNYKKQFINALVVPSVFILILFTVHSFAAINEIKLSTWGVYPREKNGLWGIVSSIFIHGSWKHLANNSIPLLVLGTALFYFYKKLAIRVCVYSIIFTGILLWLGGRPSFHIGASGLVYSLASFLFLSGFIRKHNNLMALSMTVVFLYGSLVWGIFPTKELISWEGHLFGAINGILWAIYYKKEGPQRKKYSWEIEEEILNSLDEIEGDYQSNSGNEQRELETEIIYEYKIKNK
tara:strand:+ start:2542 stop:3243 length:702 start_codon:yes stop_codon:yes gene_type:complete